MDRGPPDASSSPIEPEALLGLVDELREADYHIGVEHYVAAQDVVLALAAQGESFDQPDRLRRLLGPLLCSTPREQEDFKERFDAWAGRLMPGLPRPIECSARPADAGIKARGDKRKRRKIRPPWKWALGTFGSLLLVAGIVWWRGPEPPRPEYESPRPGIARKAGTESQQAESGPALPPPSLPAARPSKSRPGGAAWLVSSIVLAALLVALWRSRGQLYLARWALAGTPDIQPLAVKGPKGELFHEVSLARTAREMRRRREIPARGVDVSATIEKTVRQGGFLTPVPGTRQVLPEYLVLVDRTSYRDHLAKLVGELLSRLKASGVLISRYCFDGDPRICFPFNEGASPLGLRELGARYPDHDLLIFSDAAGLFNARTGELSSWAQQLSSWRRRAILTPVEAPHWGPRESVLLRHFAVLPATPSGLARLVRPVDRGETSAAREETAAAVFPRSLEQRPLRWLDHRAPDDSVVENTLASVRRYLGEGGFYWLRACAVYPQLDWHLTVYLGNALRTADGRKLLELRRLTALARLPWLRHGYMPDWLRSRLVRTFSQEQKQRIRAALNGLLRTALRSSAGGFTLPIAREKSVLRLLFGMGREKNPLKDHVFVTFMAGRLALPLPRLLSDFLRPVATRLPPLTPKALRFAGAAVLLLAGLLALRFLLSAPVERATLILDATPWAQITRIEDARGDPLPLAAATYTPFALDLQPGVYIITLENPNYPTRMTTVEIDAPGVTTPPPVVLGEVDLDRYFEAAGLATIIEEDTKENEIK